MHHKNWR